MISVPAGSRGCVTLKTSLESVETLRALQRMAPQLLLVVLLWDGTKDHVRLGDLSLEHAQNHR
jgi:hypothetical protein